MWTLNELNITTPGAEVEYIFDDVLGGERYVVSFPNSYGASIIRNPMSYGSQAGKYELGVIHNYPKNIADYWPLCYRTPITNDVIGWLSPEDVYNLLVKISELPDNPLCTHFSDYFKDMMDTEDDDAGLIH